MIDLRTVYVVVGTMRSGTTLLCQMLQAAGAGRPTEYLNGTLPWLPSVQAYAARITAAQSGAWIGLKLLAFQLSFLLDHWGARSQWTPITLWQALLGALHPDAVRYVVLTRRDTLAQAVSAFRAETLNRWSCPADQMPRRQPLPYTPEAVARVEALRAAFENGQTWIDQLMTTADADPLRLTYEEFTSSETAIRQTFQRVCAHVGYPLASDYHSPIPLRKQAGPYAQAWIEQYRQDHQKRGLG